MSNAASTQPTWLDWLAYLALRSVIALIQSASLESCDRYCRIIARFLANFTRLRRAIVDANLDLVYGRLTARQKRHFRYAMWHNLLLMLCEIAHAPLKIHRTNWREHFYMPHKREFLRHMMDQRATVLVCGHYGNFEVAGYATGLLGLPTATIARPLDNPLVDQFIVRFRSMQGQKILPKEGSSTAVQEILAQGGTLALLADQYAGRKGCWVDFFGHPTSCHKALALFVLSSKAPMIVNYNRRLDRPLRYEMATTGIADPREMERTQVPEHFESVKALTRWYNVCLEDAIRKSPEQYWWLHRRWRAEEPRRAKRAKNSENRPSAAA